MITVGIDIGSLATKAVVLNHDGNVLSYDIELTIGDNRKASEKVFHRALSKVNIAKQDIDNIITTGYGRENVPFSNGHVTEITCHAMGAHFLFPKAKTILDIGGQDSKAIRSDSNGQVVDFVMNDKCAAGTGRFLEVIAHALGVTLKDLGELSQQANKSIQISSMCTVFAESEVVSLIAKGSPIPDIVRGVHNAIATRSATLLNKIGIIEPLFMSGGVANNIGVIRALENKLKLKVNVPDQPQLVGALGAGIIAQRNFKK